MYIHSPDNVDKSVGSVVRLLRFLLICLVLWGTLNFHICQPGLHKENTIFKNQNQTKQQQNSSYLLSYL